MKKLIHITHNDADAVGCAFIYATAQCDMNSSISFTDIETVFCAIGSQDEKLNNILDEIDENKFDINFQPPYDITISDLSISVETAKRLERLSIELDFSIHGYDHHPTNTLDKDFDWFMIVSDKETRDLELNEDVLISATKIMYSRLNKFCKHKSFEKLRLVADMISRYDTWEWVYHPGKYTELFEEDLFAKICSFFGPEKMYTDMYFYYLNNRDDDSVVTFIPPIFIDIYGIMKDNEAKYNNGVKYKTKVYKNIALLINNSQYTNSAAHYILKNYPDINIVIIIYPDSNKIGMRTNDESIDLGRVVKSLFNGGGHKKAAGASLSKEDMVSLYQTYQNCVTINDLYNEDTQ